MDSQKKMILNYLQTGKGITAIEALRHFGCFRLAARINDLRRDGYDIKTEMIDINDRKRFALYTLIN